MCTSFAKMRGKTALTSLHMHASLRHNHVRFCLPTVSRDLEYMSQPRMKQESPAKAPTPYPVGVEHHIGGFTWDYQRDLSLMAG